MIQRFFELYNGEDLRAVRGVERGVFLTHEAITDRHIVTNEEVETHPFYQTLNKMGLKYFATVPICPDWRMNAGVAVQRKVGRAPYSEDELELLTMLGRHVERAFRLGAKLLDSEMSSIGLGNALNKLGMGIFVLDGLCRVTFANSAAERLLGDTHYG
ncbi:PAS domain-containing protein [Rhizobium pisi]|uniref:PAS domain-containing protein n=1 Tax=Rhizobium pisi TaxID=574561 RepID=UPI0039B0129B